MAVYPFTFSHQDYYYKNFINHFRGSTVKPSYATVRNSSGNVVAWFGDEASEDLVVDDNYPATSGGIMSKAVITIGAFTVEVTAGDSVASVTFYNSNDVAIGEWTFDPAYTFNNAGLFTVDTTEITYE